MNDFLQLDKKVALKPYVPRKPLPVEYATDDEIWQGAGGTLIIDTETYRNFFLLQMLDIKTRKVIRFEIRDDVTINTQKLSWVMHSYRTVGFNSIKYDLALIWFAFIYQNNEAIKSLSDEIIIQNAWPKQLERDHGFTIWPTNHIDLIEVCPLRGSLKLYGGRLHAPRIQDLPFDVHAELSINQFSIVADYNISDLFATEILFNNLTEQLQLRTDLSREYKQDVMSKSDAQIAETVISSELKRLTGKWPSKPALNSVQTSFNYHPPAFIQFLTPTLQNVLQKVCSIKYTLMDSGRLNKGDIDNINIQIGANLYRMGSGGLHSSEKNLAIKADHEHKLFDRDVASYYPAIVLNCKLFPNHLGEAFLQVYQTIVDRRITAKKAGNIAISECLKICINGTFGKTGSPYSVLYAPEMMIQITVTGQLALLMLIEKLELCNIPVASANTDGILVYCPIAKEDEYRSIIKLWEQITGFITEETEYDAIYSRDVNAYLAVKKDGSTKGKNVYYDPWRAKTARDGYWRFQKNPSTQICIEAIEKLITKNIPIEKTIKECRDITKFVSVKNVAGGAHKDGEYLGRVVRWYYAKDVVGTINYINSGNKVPDTDGAKPAMDLPETWPEDINYDWYIAKAVEMLFEMGYYKRAEQLKFF